MEKDYRGVDEEEEYEGEEHEEDEEEREAEGEDKKKSCTDEGSCVGCRWHTRGQPVITLVCLQQAAAPQRQEAAADQGITVQGEARVGRRRTEES